MLCMITVSNLKFWYFEDEVIKKKGNSLKGTYIKDFKRQLFIV